MLPSVDRRTAAGGSVRPGLALGLAAAVLVACSAGPAPERREEGRLGPVEFFRPEGPASGFVVLLSDERGWSPAWERAARELVCRGAAVVGVDLGEYLVRLRASDDG
jgi:type IV secretory pathway VirJ component